MATIDKCENCGCSMAELGLSEDQKMCLDCQEFKKVDDFAKANGINRAYWDFDADTDFSAKHAFPKAKYATCRCIEPARMKIQGDTWLDIYKVADKMCCKTKCDHTFVEYFTQKGNTLVIHFGS